ncbi:NAD(P)H-quinone oxidoreductase [Oceanobacillus caeni]|uniref:NAD(P)H-quinone oxidoreductase n=1 Tax=Oceanobacillus TaxID=182709 RepID=UPI000621B8FB|nr:NAD(P)H-quinone oxidoreductase [Oceanobacillus caeni]KKE80330.1 NADPH:quinone oxidoreductase [Bacilli bacterium VT-13-104]PZD81504.1 NAD(P)H-quinone oxidoreductase [Bacilli bacterium]MCR1835463.1 NAD(P)H-quinone oxidoreductase [Oceanobacillus caeni]PZD83527.1 NAD(P)H-quinone oxidoreductase [Bacilli bacterium]PZD85267.1 NAD(P)H-quinone oxidoreductase [Bacilli bacterium]
MKGIIVREPGGSDQLELTDLPIPTLSDGELLIKVETAAVNRTDIVTREGKSGYAKSAILGVEVAGIVEKTSETSHFKIGDRVMGLVNGGGYAEYAVMPANRALKIPDNLSFEEAAAIPEVFLTAYQTLYWIGKLKRHETVLIHAGASGVGTAAIQLAKQVSDAKVIVTAGSKEKLEFCKQLGADTLINYKEQSFDEEVLQATDGEGVDVILDFIGASYWEKNLASIKKAGRWVLIGVLGGGVVEKVNLMELMAKYVQLSGTLLTPRSDEYKADLTKEFAEVVMPHLERGNIKPIIDTVFPIEEVATAHNYMEENRNIGKIILRQSL